MTKKQIFKLNRAEIIGILVLLFFILFVLIFLKFDYSDFVKTDLSKDKIEIDKFLSQNAQQKHFENSKYQQQYPVRQTQEFDKNLNPFEFDPNNMSEAEWSRLGLNSYQIKILINYTAKGGKFRTKEDFSKIYSISKEEYKILEPYINISKVEYNKSTKPAPVIVKIDINAANAEDLVEVPGIGPSFAKSIIKYRQVLGGYTNKTQLLEVFNMDSTNYERMSPYFTFGLDSIKKQNVNILEYKQICLHPYFSKKIAYKIIEYRQQKGRIKNIEEFKTITNISDFELQRLLPYLSF